MVKGKGLLLTTKDVMEVFGYSHYNTASRYLVSLRDALGKKSTHILISEFCKYEEFDFNYIWGILRDSPIPK